MIMSNRVRNNYSGERYRNAIPNENARLRVHELPFELLTVAVYH